MPSPTHPCTTRNNLFDCLRSELLTVSYTAQLAAWLAAFPSEQVMLTQYESLVSPERAAAQVKDVKK